MKNILEIVQSAKKASLILVHETEDIKNKILEIIADKISKNSNKIFEANEKDLELSKTKLEKGEITQATYGRLKLDVNKMRDMIQGVRDVINLPDPVNVKYFVRELDQDLILEKISTPIGVIGVIFEARPDVILQISSLAIKSGNAVILKGGSESNNTNEAIFNIINKAIMSFKPELSNIVNILYSRDEIKEILALDKYIDLIIPRGSNKLVKYIQENTKIPVLGHASGICHIFVDKTAKYEMAKNIIIDSKTQYPAACNSVETVLIHKDFNNIDQLKRELLSSGIKIVEKPESWDIEYGDKILSLKIVPNLLDAIEHINTYGSHHTDSIITEDDKNAELFLNSVDSANIFHNISTRFSDGFRYGFGAEVGISTNKTHARGPVGLDGLTIYKYIVRGKGQIVDDYVNGYKKFTHKDIS